MVRLLYQDTHRLISLICFHAKFLTQGATLYSSYIAAPRHEFGNKPVAPESWPLAVVPHRHAPCSALSGASYTETGHDDFTSATRRLELITFGTLASG
jgi:hypothetical protein